MKEKELGSSNIVWLNFYLGQINTIFRDSRDLDSIEFVEKIKPFLIDMFEKGYDQAVQDS